MMNINAEFKTNTFAGITSCNVDKTIWRNPRDIETVEDAIKWVKKVFEKGTDTMVTFGFFDNEDHNFSRLFKDWRNGVQGVREIHWNGHGTLVSDIFHEKLTNKLIRELYLDTADKYIEWEERKGA